LPRRFALAGLRAFWSWDDRGGYVRGQAEGLREKSRHRTPQDRKVRTVVPSPAAGR